MKILQFICSMGSGKRICYSSFCEMFREQVNTISSWFDQWNECEKTVALYSLIKRVTHVNARFLSLVLDQTVGDSHELQLHEQQANNPGTLNNVTALLQKSNIFVVSPK